MTTLDDFRETLTEDPADWLVLADWLEERDDVRGRWVRFVAEKSLGHAAGSARAFRARYLRQDNSLAFFSWVDDELRRIRWDKQISVWFDVVIALSHGHARWEGERERLLNLLDDELRQIALLRLDGYSYRDLIFVLATDQVTLQRQEMAIFDRWRAELKSQYGWGHPKATYSQ